MTEQIDKVLNSLAAEGIAPKSSLTDAIDLIKKMYKEEQNESNESAAFFLCMYVPMSDIKKPDVHFLVAVNTDEGMYIVDKNAASQDDNGKVYKGMYLSQEDYVDALKETAINLEIPYFNFSPVQLNKSEFEVFYPGLIGVAQIVTKQQKLVWSNELVRRCIVSLKALFMKKRPTNLIIEMVIFDVFKQSVRLKGNPNEEGYDITLGHDHKFGYHFKGPMNSESTQAEPAQAELHQVVV